MQIFSKPKKQKETLVLVFDVGSSSVGGALFLRQQGGAPKILYTLRESIKLEADLDHQRFFETTLKTLREVAGKMCLSGHGKPSEVYCVLSSPWFASQTRVIELEKNTPFIFTSKLADGLIEKEMKLFQEEHAKKYGEDMNRVRAIELKTMSTSLNGYKTSKPFGQKAKELEMSIFISMSQESLLGEIEKSIIRHFNVPEVKFISFAMASFAVARDMFVNQESFLLVNIGGEVTDISMVKKEVIRESISFPIGENFIIRRLAKGLKTTFDEARSFMTIYNEGHMADALLKKTDPVITEIRTEWLRNFQESLRNLTNDISIPATIFITVNKDLADFFSKTIKTEQLNQYTLTESKFRMLFLSIESLHGIAIVKDDVVRDPFLIIESIYINQFLR
ncbi:MAG: hypothetical protein KG003_05695 [Bacteroidetes bacterium]|nr:hypothetical protein [Bacteroidota bacterium]